MRALCPACVVLVVRGLVHGGLRGMAAAAGPGSWQADGSRVLPANPELALGSRLAGPQVIEAHSLSAVGWFDFRKTFDEPSVTLDSFSPSHHTRWLYIARRPIDTSI